MNENVDLSDEQIETFNHDGFLVIESVLDASDIEKARARFEPLFRGEFDLGIQPDEWNWREGRDSEDLTRQICNGWKSDSVVRSIVLREDLAKLCAVLKGWPGARINQDNVLWKPPGARALGFHQDDSFQTWITPSKMMTCWITLDDTLAEQGTIEYVRGSHLWPVSPPITQFHAPDDPLLELRQAAQAIGKELDIVPIVVPAGSIVLHDGGVWHGSRANKGSAARRSLVAHCMSSEAQFSSTGHSPIYSRYKKQGTNEMDESFFPILYREDGYRSQWIDQT